MKIGKVIDQDFDAWKGKTSMVLLVMGCNMQCSYCWTRECVKNTMPKIDWKPSLDKVRHSIDGVVITGGEPLIQQHIGIFCKKMKLFNLKVRIETNGSKPDLLKQLLARKVVDSIAMDVKAPFNEYPRIARSGDSMKVMESIKLLQKSGIDHELRTTWSPDLTEEQVLATAKQCTGSTWTLQAFVPGNCLNPEYNNRQPTPYDLLKSTASKAEGPSEIRIKSEKGEEKVS